MRYKESFKEYVSLNDSIDTVGDFFFAFKDNYSSMYFNILQEKNNYNGKEETSVEFIPFNSNDLSEVRSDGKVVISYQNNINDVYSIAHEITHKFSQPRYQNSTIKSFLGETSTIAMEFLLEEYLLNNTSYDKDSREYKIFSINGENYLNDIVNKGNLQFPIRQRYVIGTALACDFNQKEEKNTVKKEQLSYLIDILGHTNLSLEDDLRIAKGLDIPILNNNSFEITDGALERIANNYKNEINNTLAKENTKDKSY